MKIYGFWLFAAGLLAALARAETNNEHSFKRSPTGEKALEVLRASLIAGKESSLVKRVPREDVLRNGLREAARLAENNVLLQEVAATVLENADHAPDADRAVTDLEFGIRQAIELLTFEPLMETELPRGFPPPTPVGEIAVKNYPAYRAARTNMDGESRAFWRLFAHISTNQIAMTAPVEVTYSGPSQAADDRIERKSMAFLYSDSSLGKPATGHAVSVVDLPRARYVSIGMREDWNSQAIAAARKHLLQWIQTHSDEYKIAGNLRMMGYNSPMIPVSNRYFEVELPIEPLRREAKKANVGENSESR